MAGGVSQGQRALAKALRGEAGDDRQAQADPSPTEIDRRAACRRLSRQPMQDLVAGAVIRQLDAVIFAHSTEDFAKPAPSIDDARLRGRYESKRRGLQARIQQWLRRAQAASARPIAKQRGIN